MTSPRQISTEQKMQQHTGFERCIPMNRAQKQQAQKQQARWKPESNHVIEGYPFTVCYFWTAHGVTDLGHSFGSFIQGALKGKYDLQ